ncbi:MAG: glycosyltransferase family 2 protein [Chitinophagaceae bacterium]
MKKILSIVVTYNGMQWIHECIGSLSKSIYPTEIIVIDNCSSDETVAQIKKNFPKVKIIESERNLGFGQANNIGFREAIAQNADYVFLLNQDAWIELDTLKKLIEIHQQHAVFGILSPLHLNKAGTALDKFFFEYLQQSNSENLTASELLIRKSNSIVIETPFVNAAAWLVSIETIKQIGGFNPLFFHYGEDRNYVQRAIYMGIHIGVCTNARIYHDRDERIRNTVPNILQIIKKEKTEFLIHAGNIHRKNYFAWTIRRLLGFMVRLFNACLIANRNKILFNFEMAVFVVRSIPKIHKSHQRSGEAGAFLCSEF